MFKLHGDEIGFTAGFLIKRWKILPLIQFSFVDMWMIPKIDTNFRSKRGRCGRITLIGWLCFYVGWIDYNKYS